MKYNNTKSFLLLLSSSLSLDAVIGQQPEFQPELDEALLTWQNRNTDKYFYKLATTLQSTDGSETIQAETNFGIHAVMDRVVDVFIVEQMLTLPATEPTITREEVSDSLAETAVTIDRLFELIQEAIDSPRNPTIRVTYNRQFGHPTTFAIHYPTTDGDSSIGISRTRTPIATAAPVRYSTASSTTTTTTTTTSSNVMIINPDHMVGSIETFVPTSYRQEQIIQYKEEWAEYEYLNYDMVYQRTMMDLPPPITSEVTIQVRDGVVSKVIEVETGDDVTNHFTNFGVKPPTMIDIFDMVESTLSDEFPIDYDVDYVFPYPYLEDVDIDFFDVTTKVASELKFVVSDIIFFHQDRLDAATTLWQSHFSGDESYSFGFQNSCFCFPRTVLDPYWVTVEDGIVVDATVRTMMIDVASSSSSPSSSSYPFDDPSDFFPTIVELFDKIQGAINDDVAKIAVMYDKTYGYPLKVYIDEEEMIADDEYDVVIDGFAPVSLWQEQLESAHASWDSQCFTSYSYILQQECYGGYCLTLSDPKSIKVVDGIVVEIDGQVPSLDDMDDNDHLPPTIESLFSQIDEAINNDVDNAFSVRVVYDDEYGCPAQLYIDYDEFVADEEYSVIISDLIGLEQNCDDYNNDDESPTAAPTPLEGDDSDGDDSDESSATMRYNNGKFYGGFSVAAAAVVVTVSFFQMILLL